MRNKRLDFGLQKVYKNTNTLYHQTSIPLVQLLKCSITKKGRKRKHFQLLHTPNTTTITTIVV